VPSPTVPGRAERVLDWGVAPTRDDHRPGPPERSPELHVRFTGGPGREDWQVRCGTCGWMVRGSGDPTPMHDAATAHRCPPSGEATGGRGR
jgi:hypothetical protein